MHQSEPPKDGQIARRLLRIAGRRGAKGVAREAWRVTWRLKVRQAPGKERPGRHGAKAFTTKTPRAQRKRGGTAMLPGHSLSLVFSLCSWCPCGEKGLRRTRLENTRESTILRLVLAGLSGPSCPVRRGTGLPTCSGPIPARRLRRNPSRSLCMPRTGGSTDGAGRKRHGFSAAGIPAARRALAAAPCRWSRPRNATRRLPTQPHLSCFSWRAAGGVSNKEVRG
jgi:hypothetical protein